ncbi:MAG: Gfo/Idh/MocA family oxidoreductase [Bacteroidetes bacterium]|nr:Gfo/Idh/MocA family oxidoreductase [Bacteroidota bacterium]
MKKRIWLIGAGSMAVEYAKVLKSLDVDFWVIGRGKEKAKIFKQNTGVEVITGGLSAFILQAEELPTHAIVATGVEALAQTTIELIEAGVTQILCEKPGGLNKNEIEQVAKLAEQKNATVLLAYNRRFYASVIKAKEIIEEDGGVTSFNFEFTEWSHIIATLKKHPGVKESLFLNNSTHVVDLAFYLGGFPKEVKCFTAGGFEWHPSSSVFAGAGVSETGALFCYQANWEAPGRWVVEVLTKNHRLYFKPMEKLMIQKKGSIQLEDVYIDDVIDKSFKPGLFKQVEAFLENKHQIFISIEQQLAQMDIYQKMADYK